MAAPPIYLDHAATTPVLPEVRDAMDPYLRGDAFGNPSSPHQVGRAARAALDEARYQLGHTLGADPASVVFTSGGTEADNLAVLGRALAVRDAGGPFRVAVSAIEHKAVVAAAHVVASLGGEMIELPVDSRGMLDRDALTTALDRGVALVSVMWVNNEIGVVQDVAAIAERCAAAGVTFHTDAVQALGKVPVEVSSLGPIILTVSAHKIGGPKGVGALLVQGSHAIAPLLHGGGQQGGVRPGTENVPGIVGFGRAAELAAERLEATSSHTRSLRESFEDRLCRAIPDVRINGADGPRAPHICNVAIPGTDSEAMLMHLDLAGICCSSGSACTTGTVEPSHVLTAIGMPPDLGRASLRFSFGHGNSMDEIDRVMDALPAIIARVRSLGEVLRR